MAPQFAVDAADSSAGKFWEPNGFRRFLDEAAVKLARMYGDPRSASLSPRCRSSSWPIAGALDRPCPSSTGAASIARARLVLLDALYGGIDKFADWIADNRSTFFVSSYTPHTAHHNAYLNGCCANDPCLTVPNCATASARHGDVPARRPCFAPGLCTHAWADNPIKDILARMDDVDPRIQTAGTTASIPATRN